MIIAFDFDGTLVADKYPNIESPNWELLNWIKNNKEKNNFIFILWTCRHGKELDDAVRWLKEKAGIEFDYVNENVPELIKRYGDSRKVYADLYIDDSAFRCLTFETITKYMEEK